MAKTQFIRQINFETQKLLKRIQKQSSHYQVRQRSHCLLLKNQGVKLKQLKNDFCRQRENFIQLVQCLGIEGISRII